MSQPNKEQQAVAPPQSRLALSVLIPAFNEGGLIQDNLREVLGVLNGLFDSYEVILVDDASPDDTYSEAEKVANEDPRLRVIRATRNGGKGHALRVAFNNSRGETIAFLDADLDLPPGQLGYFASFLESSGADVVVGSKRHPESKIVYPGSRRFLSGLYSAFVRFAFRLPVRDTQTGLKVYRREVLEEVFPKMKCERFAFDLELLALAHRFGYRLAELPVELRFRRKMRFGRVRSRDFALTALDTFGIFLRVKIMQALKHPFRRNHRVA